MGFAATSRRHAGVEEYLYARHMIIRLCYSALRFLITAAVGCAGQQGQSRLPYVCSREAVCSRIRTIVFACLAFGVLRGKPPASSAPPFPSAYFLLTAGSGLCNLQVSCLPPSSWFFGLKAWQPFVWLCMRRLQCLQCCVCDAVGVIVAHVALMFCCRQAPCWCSYSSLVQLRRCIACRIKLLPTLNPILDQAGTQHNAQFVLVRPWPAAMLRQAAAG